MSAVQLSKPRQEDYDSARVAKLGDWKPGPPWSLVDLILVSLGLFLAGGAIVAGLLTRAGTSISGLETLTAGLLLGVLGVVLIVLGIASSARHILLRLLQLTVVEGTPVPKVGHSPYRNPYFIDREIELDRLWARLSSKRRVAIVGLGGVGKSQLALEYLHRRRAEYPDGIFWLRGEKAATLRGDLAALASLQELALADGQVADQEKAVVAVRDWLRRHERWLLVVDNLDPDAVPPLEGLLPPPTRGHVLVTTRLRIWSEQLALETFTTDVATEFLLRRTGQTDVTAAAAVAAQLGNLPLALEQAAAYMRTTGRELSAYGKLVGPPLDELFGEGTPEHDRVTITETWVLTLASIEAESPATADLLRLCAFFAPTDIPISLLQSQAEEVGGSLGIALKNSASLNQIIALLLSYSLVRREGNSLNVNGRIQAVIRQLTPPDRTETWLAVALRILAAGFPQDSEEPSTWAVCARLLPHAQVVLEAVGGQAADARETSSLLVGVANYLAARGESLLGIPYLERAVAIDERDLGTEHPQTAASMNDLGMILRDRGELDAARPYLERALAIRERVLGSDHPETAASLNNLAMLLADQGELNAARRLLDRALAIRERLVGPDDPQTAASLNNLGMLLRDQGELEAARPRLEQALSIVERALGPDHPQTAASLNNLGMLLKDQGELDAARPYLERALSIWERALGPDHPQTAASLNNLGMLLWAQRDLDAARILLDRALVSRELVLGPDHPETAASLDNLGMLLWAQRDLDASRLLLERALAIRENVLGRHHLDTANSLNNLGIVLRDGGHFDAARAYLEQALAIRERVLGPDHPSTTALSRAVAAL